MNKILCLVIFFFSFFSETTFALFCPNGFNDMNLGDSIEQVTQSCGTPDNKKTSKAPPGGKAQEWNYYLSPNTSQPGTLKMSIAFDDSQKVINISVNGTSVVTTPICGGKSVQYGSTTDAVKAACGSPSFINESPQQTNSNSSSTTSETEITEFTYNTTPPTTLVFVNGKLKERK